MTDNSVDYSVQLFSSSAALDQFMGQQDDNTRKQWREYGKDMLGYKTDPAKELGTRVAVVIHKGVDYLETKIFPPKPKWDWDPAPEDIRCAKADPKIEITKQDKTILAFSSTFGREVTGTDDVVFYNHFTNTAQQIDEQGRVKPCSAELEAIFSTAITDSRTTICARIGVSVERGQLKSTHAPNALKK